MTVKLLTKTESIFNSTAEALVNPVNIVGVMGAGLAHKFKITFPDMYKEYVEKCKDGSLRIGKVHVYKIPDPKTETKYIINLPTKVDWKNNSKINYVERGINALVKELIEREIRSVAIPAIGCGLGELQWVIVYPLIYSAFDPIYEITAYVYPPKN